MEENKDNKSFLIGISAFVVLIVLCIIFACHNLVQSYAEVEHRDSIAEVIRQREIIEKREAREKFVKDSIARASHAAWCEKTKEELSHLFNIKTDEYTGITIVKPKSAPKYVNQNGVYCYFNLDENNKPETFRFVLQYKASEWLFIEYLYFNIDNEHFSLRVPSERDCGYGYIWEWCDLAIPSFSGADLKFITELANAKSVKIKMRGHQYYDTRTLTKAQIKSIKDTYDYFRALGGKIKKQ